MSVPSSFLAAEKNVHSKYVAWILQLAENTLMCQDMWQIQEK